MEETSREKNDLKCVFPYLIRLSNPSNVRNTSLTEDLGMNTFDGLQIPVCSGVSLDRKCEFCCDKCLNPSKNSAELLKSFKQQWYKSRDSHQYKHLPYRTNICKKPPKIQRTNKSLQMASVISSSPSQEVSQVSNVAPADPSMLEKILNDPTGYINVQGKLREVRFYGEKSIVMMDWNDPRDVCFQSSSRRVIIDEKDILILSFNSPYINYTFPDGSTIRIRLGAPTRDFYIDGEPVEIKFGGPPVNVLVGDSYHKIQLGGPNPKVYVGNVKRSDFMAGRINLIIDEDLNNIFHIYLDAKPQKFDINGVPFIMRFADSLQTVFINERPIKTEFGGAPIAVKLFDDIHLLRFSALPLGIVPGLVHIINMESKKTDPAVKNLFPFILPWNDPKLTSLTSIANNNHYHFNYHYHGDAANSEVPTAQNSNSLCKHMCETNIQQNTGLDANGIDVLNLYQKLVEKGIIQPPGCEKRARNDSSKSITVDFSNPESLKLRNMRIVYELYTGAQCDICTLRFMRKSGEYASHVDWHYQMKTHALHQQPNWWCHKSEFPRSEQDVGDVSWFEKQKRLDPFSIYEKLTVPAKDYGLLPTCSFCNEEFNQFYDDVTDEWLLRNAVVHNRKLCHPICCLKENQHNLTLLQVEMNTKKMVTPGNDVNKISKRNSRGNISLENENVPTIEQYDTVLSCDIVHDRISIDTKVNEMSSNENNNMQFFDDFQDEDIEEVVVIQPQFETVDLSKDDINNFDNSPNVEMADPRFEELRAEVNLKHQLNEDDPNGLADYTSTDNYTEFPSSAFINNNPITINMHPSHSTFNNDYGNKEMEFNELSRMTPETVKPLIMNSAMTVQPDVIKGEIITSMCSIM